MELDDLPSCPEDLRNALRDQGATVARLTNHAPRFHIRLESPSGPLFAWYSCDPTDREALEHELRVREIIGTQGVLKAPPVLVRGDNWRLERMVASRPVSGARTIALVLDAWRELTELTLPPRPRRASPASLIARAARRVRLLVSPLPVSDLVSARRQLRRTDAPTATQHGDFHVAHLLPDDQSIWVIDWELAGTGPLGLDLMQLWASLPDEEDRQLLFEGALAVVGRHHRERLFGLRHAALVSRIVAKLTEYRRFGDPDRAEAERLLRLLPEVRTPRRGSPL